MPDLRVAVEGMTPIPWGSNEWAWRKAIAEQARAERLHQQIVPAVSATRFCVAIVFFMTAAHIQRADLDNLAKPVLDTLFLIRNAQVRDMSLTGALFDVDDARVFKLSLEKEVVPNAQHEGVQVTISWE